jgi:hypothetical protein
MSVLITYLQQRADAATFLLPVDMGRALADIFPRDIVLPVPYNIFPADETQSPTLGFPVAETPLMKELDQKLERWIAEEVLWHVKRDPSLKEKAQLAFSSYLNQLMKAADNAMMSRQLSDYDAIFWLAHSFDLSRHFSSIPRRVSALDTQMGRTQGDALKYRIFARWVADTRDMMLQLVAKAAPVLDGDEQRSLQFFRLLQDDTLILTEEFLGPDLRELRSFITGSMRRDFQAFRDGFERLRTTTTDLLTRDRTFRNALTLFGANPEQGITLALLLDPRFQVFAFDHPSVQNVLTREEREQFNLIARRVREFAVLNQLRRGIIWMTATPDGQIVSTDRRNGGSFSRSTRPMDFGRNGVVDPVVHRFGLIYDISAFSETLGNIRRGGRKEEVSSYRQMLLFQRRLENIAQRHLLQFEKFLGDGAFYTTRRAVRLIRAAVEIQRYYSDMKSKGFAFNKGLRIALNFGYYRLLSMKGAGNSTERITEFYGPGIVELSRLTTGKANKEIDEIASFLVAQGFDQQKVQAFFAPLARGVDVIDHKQHAREFYAYINQNGHLVNEGIVASVAFMQELSTELANEAQQLHRLTAPWGTYIGFAPAVPGVEYIAVRLLGMVALKGLDGVEVAEIVPFVPGEVEAEAIDGNDLVTALRQEFHQKRETPTTPAERNGENDLPPLLLDTTREHQIESELVICMPPEPGEPDDEVLIGEWDPRSDEVTQPLRLPRSDFKRLFAMNNGLSPEVLMVRRDSVRDMYFRLCDKTNHSSIQLQTYRSDASYDAFVIGAVVEKL